MEMDSEHLGESTSQADCAHLHLRKVRDLIKTLIFFFLQFEYLHFGQNVTPVLFNYTDYSHLRATITFNLSQSLLLDFLLAH